ncbi:hypothetical protein [Chryseolinea sp. H1M3-3]|uniref:hypothetical protein n=1 Tax=Chryseolinea sp. H1M3-3 TaxID=3034144 RepID=UPI0023ED8348|nr:hypothetical protein [Chryseolinea sp. H1M3-3]
MKSIFILCNVLLITCSSLAQMNIHSMHVYEYFPDRGFTTAGLTTKMQELKANGVKKIAVPTSDVELLAGVMNRAKVKKHIQTKIGIGAAFGQVVIASDTLDVIVLNNLIIDLTNYVNYWIKDDGDQALVFKFLQRMRNVK